MGKAMNKSRFKKVMVLFAIILVIIQIISPAVFAEQQSIEATQNNTSEQISDQTIESVSQSTEISRTEGKSSVSSSEEKQTMSSEQEIQSKRYKQTEPRSSNDISDEVSVNDWWIFENSVDDPLSATKAASAKVDYNFQFIWSLKKMEGQYLTAGEYFCIDMPENIGIASEGIEAWGFWSIGTTETHKTDLKATINGVEYTIGQWWTDWRDDGSPRGKYYMKVAFNDEVTGKEINQITGIQFNIPEKSLKNMTLKGGIQEVTFGNKIQRIKFEQAKEEYSEGDDYKYNAQKGSNTLTFDIGIGRMTLNELSGDVVDYDANQKTGFYLDGDYHGYRWGENLTELDDIYLEDTLDPGVVVSSISLSALVQSPIGLSEENLEMQTGGLINRDVATFESYLFADYGNGPVYRTAGSNQEIKFPKQENSYKVLVQKDDETLAAFRERVKAHPQQYGIYTEGTGKTARRTICINIGDIHKENGVQKKYSDLTDQKYAVPERTITRKAGSVLGAEEVKITQFAVEAASNSIKHGFYPESYREILEDYYTLAYGDGNVINGQVSSFNISMKLNYPIDETLGETKTNTALAYYSNAKQQENPNFNPPNQLTGEGNMTNPYGKIAINTDTIALIKYDGATLEEMNNVEFELQKKSGLNWNTLSTHETKQFTTSEGEKVQGVIQVSGLDNGTYRFVEKNGENNIYPEGYDQTKSSDWNTSENRIVSKEIVVDGQTTNDPVVIENIPIASAPYAIEHYFLKDGKSASSTNQEDFELNFVENETGEIRKPIGSIFTGKPRNNLTGYSYKKITELEKDSGTITAITDPNLSYKENGQLVLRFYYVPDDDSIPFTITKLDMADKPMPSYDAQGNALEHEVSFYIYEFDWGNSEGKSPTDAGVEPEKGTSNDYWKLVETDNQGNALQQPIKTDSQGRIRAKIDLTDNGVIGNAKTFAVVEAENTYPNYEAPSVEDAWWFIWTGTGADNSSPKGTFSWCNNMGANNPGCINDTQEDKSQRVSLKNKTSKGNMKVYKADQDKNMMSSDAKKQVKFEFYEYIDDGNWTEGRKPEDGHLDDPTIWKSLGTVQTDADGKIIDHDLTAVKTYALKEISSYPSFAVPTGYWILWTSSTSEGIVNHQVSYVQGSNDDSGIVQPDAEENSIGSAILLNKEIKQEFSFIKENEQGDPLGEVEFDLYAGKENEVLEIGTNDDPNAANTYWNMSEPFKSAISNAAGTNKGKVSFDLAAGTYLLVETKAASGYQLPAGQWILTIDPLHADPDQRIKIQARGDPLPPAFYEKDGVYHLPNMRKYKLPSSGSFGMIFSVILGVILIGFAILVRESRPEKN
ncbi:hypothetical protein RV13_GL003869 [Enterococcus raffinosus]|nr:hypothetical protein RV13_GL003869 [Enterococcus raffinosus]